MQIPRFSGSLLDAIQQLMRVIDELHLEFPFIGDRQQLSRHLFRRGHKAGRLHVRPS